MGFYNINQTNLNFRMKQRKIVVDTNVLYWIFYEKGTYVKAYQKTAYQNFFSDSIKDNNYIVTTLTINELFTIIERNEYELYCNAEGINKEDFSLKKFRKIAEKRESVKKICSLVYKQIEESMKIESCYIDKEMLLNYIDSYEANLMDCSDYVMIAFCKKNNIDGILTDDVDFKSFKEDMDIYSANSKIAN